MKNFSFNREQASKQDAPRSLSANGAYVGKIVQAEFYDSNSGAQMFECVFNCEGANTKLQMCVVDKHGNDTFQVGFLQSLMGLLGLSELKSQAGKAKDLRDGTIYDTYRIPSIENKPIGILLQKEMDVYTNKNNEQKEVWNMRIISFFDAETNQTYHEKANNQPAKTIEARLAQMKDRTTKRYDEWKRTQSNQGAYAQGYETAQADDYYDEVPF